MTTLHQWQVVFVNSIGVMEYLSHRLRRNGVPMARCISSKSNQEEREFDLEDFRLGRAPVLLGTDVVSLSFSPPLMVAISLVV